MKKVKSIVQWFPVKLGKRSLKDRINPIPLPKYIFRPLIVPEIPI